MPHSSVDLIPQRIHGMQTAIGMHSVALGGALYDISPLL